MPRRPRQLPHRQQYQPEPLQLDLQPPRRAVEHLQVPALQRGLELPHHVLTCVAQHGVTTQGTLAGLGRPSPVGSHSVPLVRCTGSGSKGLAGRSRAPTGILPEGVEGGRRGAVLSRLRECRQGHQVTLSTASLPLLSGPSDSGGPVSVCSRGRTSVVGVPGVATQGRRGRGTRGDFPERAKWSGV